MAAIVVARWLIATVVGGLIGMIMGVAAPV
jgi:hypothetical protein